MHATRILHAPWILVTPSSRGIGHAITRHLLQTTKAPIVATARSNLDEVRSSLLKDLKDVDANRLTMTKIDVLDESSISEAAKQCEEQFPPKENHLHIAFAIPGILNPEKSPEQIDAEKALQTFHVNALGPLLLAKHFSRFLPSKTHSFDSKDPSYHNLSAERATWACMTARVGSVADNTLGGWYSYRASKSAVNQIVRTLDIHLKQRSNDKSVAVGFHPGTVKTDLSRAFWGGIKDEKLFEKEWVAERLCGLVGDGKVERGRCWDYDGKEVLP